MAMKIIKQEWKIFRKDFLKAKVPKQLKSITILKATIV